MNSIFGKIKSAIGQAIKTGIDAASADISRQANDSPVVQRVKQQKFESFLSENAVGFGVGIAVVIVAVLVLK